MDNDKARAEKALGLFRTIYREERQIKEQAKGDCQAINTLRQAKVKPVLEQLKHWIALDRGRVLPKSKIGKAMNYFANQYHKFETIFSDARILLDNNLIENTIRPMALGRKNYLFCGSHKAAQNAAMLYSFFGTCKLTPS